MTISTQFKQKKAYVPSTLDDAQNIARKIKKEQADKLGIGFEIIRFSKYCLVINIDNCDNLSFDFQSFTEIKDEYKKVGYMYEYSVLANDGKMKLEEGYKIEEYPQNEMYYSASFCDTQSIENLVVHKWVSDIIKTVASRCLEARVND